MRRGAITLLGGLVWAALAMAMIGAAAAQEIPSFPVSYSGNVTIEGEPAPGGLSLVACVLDCDTGWQSEAVTTRADGSYFRLLVSPGNDLVNRTITFWLVNPHGRIRAAELAAYKPDPSNLRVNLDLTFGDPLPTPPPPTATPVPTRTPTPTITPIPTPTTALPIPGDPSVPRLSRIALIAGAAAIAAGGALLFVMRRRRAF